MVNKLRKSQPKAQEEGRKVNVLKRLGGKVKRVFGKKKPNEAYAPELRLGGTAVVHSNAKKDELDVVPTSVPVDEEAQDTNDHAVQELPVGASQKPANLQDPEECAPSTPQQSTAWAGYSSPVSSPTEMISRNVDRTRLTRSFSSPLSPSSPATEASSQTLNNSPGHSDAPSPDTLLNFSRILQERRGLSKKCHEARFESLKLGEEEDKNAEWLALLKWMEVSHQADVTSLKSEHAAEVQQLKQDRSQVRRKLEMKSRELRASKREVKELKETLEELTKVREETPSASHSQFGDESREEVMDEEEGGVALANRHVATTVEVCDGACVGPSSGEDDADLAPRFTKEQKGKGKESTGEDSAMPTPLVTNDINDNDNDNDVNNTDLLPQLQHLRTHNNVLTTNLTSSRRHTALLTSALATAAAEVAQLKSNIHTAELELGQLLEANVCYRAIIEDNGDVDPARTAHVDGLLKRKDKAFADLEERARECAVELGEERMKRRGEAVYSIQRMRGVEEELAHRLNYIEALSESRDELEKQNEEIVGFSRGKIFHDDALKIILKNYDVLKKDNARFKKALNERHCYVLEAKKEVAELAAKAVATEHEMEKERLVHRTTVQDVNGLTVVNNQLRARLEIEREMVEGE